MIDISYFTQISGNNSTFLLKVMNIFVNEAPKDLLALETGFSELDFKKVKEVSHKLKGLFKSYKMEDLTNLTIELENQAKAQQFTENSLELISRIKVKYSDTREEMLKLMEQYK